MRWLPGTIQCCLPVSQYGHLDSPELCHVTKHSSQKSHLPTLLDGLTPSILANLLEKFSNLWKISVSQFDQCNAGESSLRIHLQTAPAYIAQIQPEEQKASCPLGRKKSATWNVDARRTIEMFYRRTSCSLELDRMPNAWGW